jgi:hypothetical protein
MKMGTIASLRRYDVAAAEAIRPDNLRRTAILRYASWAAVFRSRGWPGCPSMAAAISINPGYGPMGHSRHRNRIIAIAQLDLDHGDCHWAVAKWSIGIGQPLWRRAMMAAGRRPDAGVPQRPRPAPDAHASLLKLPPPQIIFCAATPAPGLRPLVWVNAP